MNALEHVLNKHASIVIARLANDPDYEIPDVDSIDPADVTQLSCRLCGIELTNSSELIDDVCVVCFQKRRQSKEAA